MIIITLISFLIILNEVTSVYGIILSLIIIAQLYLAAKFKSVYDGAVKSLQDTEQKLNDSKKKNISWLTTMKLRNYPMNVIY